MKICMISIDVEEDLGTKDYRGVENLNNVLRILEDLNLRSTLFVTGEIIEKYPDLVVHWSQRHEIASHGYSHIQLNKLSFHERKKHLNLFASIYENYLGDMPKGFRAVQNTIDNTQMKLIEDLGFEYDSSVIPSYVPLKKYIGYKGKAPKKAYHPNHKNYKIEGNMRILEIPVTGLLFGVPLNGTWIRAFGVSFFKNYLFLNKPSFINFSFHSWDGINYQGPFANRSGEEFLRILFQILNFIKLYYDILPGSDIVRLIK